MSQILLRVLAVVLSGVSPEPLIEKNVLFDKLPAECAAVYDSDIRQFRQATVTDVISADLDGDNVNEILIFNGENGSGGKVYAVMQKHNGKYRKAGEVFGTLYKSGIGLIVEHSLGWDNANWDYYELVSGKLVCKLEMKVKYSKPIRKDPIKITVEMKKMNIIKWF